MALGRSSQMKQKEQHAGGKSLTFNYHLSSQQGAYLYKRPVSQRLLDAVL
jgi:hypothetical protein